MQRPVPLNEEIVLDPKRYIVSKTDTKGIITYGNEYFIEIVGYSEDELIGQPHNIIRHPDMPKIVFKVMWDRINSGKNIKAIVKNLAKDGRYYWVVTDFEPKYDPLTNKIIGHTAYRKAAPKKAVEAIEPIYQKLLAIEATGGMEASGKFLVEYLDLKKVTYDEFVDSLIEYRGLTKLFFEAMKKLFG
ncbi:PAS domain-containing protein [Campylobacter geochelonis]|uniref:Signal-transduction sensor protein n=1 Tax=Campylobacter geochelonis TaxID=1780362 RepID=A0A128EG01_9BACT|nr:PAS domain-containing protein [Campylobacter geochelonis]QKF71001.1 PAS sensor-containing two-component system histidine kinase [Campylobacter geochelonis]CZE47133.1 signal-transduction sensor protein [Campylobacter geochelonis]CZE47608.1 signal-transduction sensor protein [Campylobacter geochelonis]CZE50183.1 signal-transduction sensor protein [Campylobacter geochelonis]